MKPLSLRVCSNREIKELDELAEKEYRLDTSILMENAGQAAAQIILERFPNAGRVSEILIFAGKGNNAGDAFVVARRLICLSRRVRIFYLENPERYEGATLKNFAILQAMKAKVTQIEQIGELEAFFRSSAGPFTVVDGILGTGLKGNLEGLYWDVVEAINSQNPSEVIALDIPSGVSGDTGRIHGTSILADLTVSFAFPKLGHFLPPGAGRRGVLINAQISMPREFREQGDKFLLRKASMGALLKERDRYGHKNSFGHALLIGGSPGRLGAIAMAAGACHKMGTGLVTVATWPDSFDPLLIKLSDETMLTQIKIGSTHPDLHSYTSIVIGPGLGTRKEAEVLLNEIIASYNGPVILDADALNIISERKMHSSLSTRMSATVLTPHPGEMARLLGVSKEDVTNDPIAAVREAVVLTNAIVVLKGAATIIGSNDGVLYLNHYPNDGMATAGSGDVLAGMIGGLLGQGMDPFKGTLLGVYLHSLAGDLAAQKFGHRSMTAPDIVNNIGNAFKDIKTSAEFATAVESHIELL